MNCPFDENYFMNGIATGVSNYVDYRWLPEISLPCVHRMMNHLGARTGELVLDVGCALGMYVKALRLMGFEAFGYDISEWAIANCDPAVKSYVSTSWPTYFPDWVTMKDCAEHIPVGQLGELFAKLDVKRPKGLLIIVPLTSTEGGQYLREEDEMDKTHLIRWPLASWIEFLETFFPKYTLSASYHLPGIKPASEQVAHSTGFFKLLRQ